jgi:hypothetical protein
VRVEKPIHLYWRTVPDDLSEDWFVFATQAYLARAFFEGYEGFETFEAEVAQLSDLEALGFEILSRTRIQGQCAETFDESYLPSEIVQIRDDLAEAGGRLSHGQQRQGKPN